MARSAKPRNSRNTRKPVTIDLDAEAVVDENVNEVGSEAAETVAEATEEKLEPSADDISSSGDGEPTVTSGSTGNTRFANLSGGLVGGLLALVGGAFLQWVGVLPSFAPQPAPVEQVDLTPVQSDIENLRAEIASLQENSVASISAETQMAIDAAVGTSQETAIKAASMEETLQALGATVSEMETSISVGAAGEGAGLEALANRIVELETIVSQANGDAINIEALQAEIASVEGGLSALQTELSAQMAGLAEQISSAEDKIAGGTAGANVAGAIASAGLKSAIDRGGSFMSELETYASVAGDAETVAELRNYAASGVATISQLTDQFPSVHNRIIAVGEGLAEDAGVADRLMASARSLVQVRTVGDVEGESPDQIAARIEARLKESDLAAALSEWESLPDAAKNASAGFADSLRARLSVDALVAKALTGAMTATAPASN
ncbi:MAG: hypothetical protein AAGF25_03025 [Pseudomonadota bacterium]